MPQIQRGRYSRLSLTEAFIAISLHAFGCGGVAGTVTLSVGAMADISINTNRQFQIRTD